MILIFISIIPAILALPIPLQHVAITLGALA